MTAVDLGCILFGIGIGLWTGLIMTIWGDIRAMRKKLAP